MLRHASRRVPISTTTKTVPHSSLKDPELSIVMARLKEAETVGICIRRLAARAMSVPVLEHVGGHHNQVKLITCARVARKVRSQLHPMMFLGRILYKLNVAAFVLETNVSKNNAVDWKIVLC
jgi:hypothetical protein